LFTEDKSGTFEPQVIKSCGYLKGTEYNTLRIQGENVEINYIPSPKGDVDTAIPMRLQTWNLWLTDNHQIDLINENSLAT